MKLPSILRLANQWFSDTPERALDQAYKAALTIKSIEDEHFNGQKIDSGSSQHSDSVISYFEADLKKYLNTIRVRLQEFRTSRSIFRISEPTKMNGLLGSPDNLDRYDYIELTERQAIIIEKLNFIDQILKRYSEPDPSSLSLIPLSTNQVAQPNGNARPTANAKDLSKLKQVRVNPPNEALETVSDKTGVVPRSILRTVNRLQRELDPKAEEEVVKKFRTSRDKTLISIKFILTLIIIPILAHQVAKTFVVGPIVDSFRPENEPGIFLNIDMKEEAFIELQRFEEELHFKSLLGMAPQLSSEEMEEQLRTKAEELAEAYRYRSSDAIKNIFSDLISLLCFAGVIVTSKADFVVLKSFIDDIVYGLSDSAKAFIIILFTDMFVGFHSPHGWEVILAGISRHFGIPENHDFIFLFIATFPVILDSVIKYWIFRYLNRISPSAVATYRNMNE
ncbi:proton extrusion protein PcxA [Coleofasciculus sp.]|uniref:proton extrusion protein PcxA n=1 Tax=Coleofasciculus sp. TaxID=3100458 RepID=UPI0039F963A6